MANTIDAGPDRRRARSIAELDEKMSHLITADGFAAGLAFEPRPDDVLIAPSAKCGTTWLQQMVHSLRTGGDLDFDDISRVVPWIETAADLGLDLDAEQRGTPRAFKSHLAWDAIPKGGRYIVAVRDPRDALVSAYRFLEGWVFEPGAFDIETFARSRFIERRDYFQHLASWWPRRGDADVLCMAYERMKADPAGTVRRVAEFVGIDGDPDRLAVAGSESSLASMQAHAEKYDDLMMRAWSEDACDLPPGGGSGKVRAGQVGGYRVELSPELLARLDVTWQETIGAEFGIASYEDLLAQLATAT